MCIAFLWLGLLALPCFGQIAVSNVRAAQRAGTNLVDIDYDVTGTTLPVYVTLEVSGDDGATFAVPVSSVTGAVGRDVAPGTNLRLTWDGGADWAGHAVAQARFKVTADDNPIPPGFALIPAGSFQMGDQSNPLVGWSRRTAGAHGAGERVLHGEIRGDQGAVGRGAGMGLDQRLHGFAGGNGLARLPTHPVHIDHLV